SLPWLMLPEPHPSALFSKEELTKDTKGSENYYSELRALRVLRGEFSIEHGNLAVPVRKIGASHAIFELLQCNERKIRKGQLTTWDTKVSSG
ncbi:MAG: hypothetical protein ACXW52_22770, partial [Candidatus Binatia bacterium]